MCFFFPFKISIPCICMTYRFHCAMLKTLKPLIKAHFSIHQPNLNLNKKWSTLSWESRVLDAKQGSSSWKFQWGSALDKSSRYGAHTPIGWSINRPCEVEVRHGGWSYPLAESVTPRVRRPRVAARCQITKDGKQHEILLCVPSHRSTRRR